MSPEEVRERAARLLSELEQLDTRATSDLQRRSWKYARSELERALATGSETALQLGAYELVDLRFRVEEVERGRRKGEERARRRRSRSP